jgi:hypothetical protein
MRARWAICAAILITAAVAVFSGENPILFPVKVHDKWGYIDEQGQMVCAPRFDSAGFFQGHYLACVRSGNKWGLLFGAEDSLRAPTEFDFIEQPVPVARARKDKRWGLLNWHLGAMIWNPLDADTICPFWGDRARFRERGQWGFIDFEGKIIIPAHYDAAADFAHFSPSISGDYRSAAVELNGRWGYISDKDSLRIPFLYDSARSFSADRAAVLKDGLWGFIDPYGRTVIPHRYHTVMDFSAGTIHGRLMDLAAVCSEGRWGFIDPAGTTIVPEQFERVRPFHFEYAAVRVNGYWSFADSDGKLVVEALYDSVGDFYGTGAVVGLHGKYGYLDRNGHLAIPLLFDSAEPDGLVSQNGKFGFVNRPGGDVPEWYDDRPRRDLGMMRVKKREREIVLFQGQIIWSEPRK